MQAGDSLEDLKEKIDLFLLGLRRPVLTEPGRVVMDLSESNYSLSTEYHKLLWHVWNDQTNFVRQITGVKKESPGRMELRFQKFGKGAPGTLVLSESRADTSQLGRRSQRSLYSQTLRRFLGQLFPQWKIKEWSCEPDLGHSFSGRYTRGLISQGQRAWAVIGTGEQEDVSAAEGILTYGLIWLDWLRKRSPGVVEGLKLFVPAKRADATLHRLAWMDPQLGQWEVYETGEEVRQRDLADVGNLKTTVASQPPPSPLPPASQKFVGTILGLSPDIEARYAPGGFRLWAIRGLCFAGETPRGIVFGVGRSQTELRENTFGDLEMLVGKILRFRQPRSEDRMHPYYSLQPERWMQSVVVRQISRLGFDLAPEGVLQQVFAVSGTERGIMDLLAVSARGRLVVMELKASEDIHLPLQALDYWMRVHWQQKQGALAGQGDWGGRPIRSDPPLLLLVSPALQFHPHCATILRYFSPSIEVVRIGLNENWREQLQVVFRHTR